MRPALRTAITVAVAIVVVGMIGARAAAPASADAITNAKHFFWANGSSQTVADSASNDLLWHGGNAGASAIGVEQTPAVYLVFWGQQWADGFQTSDTDGKLYSSKTLQNYVKSFFQNVGGSPWANIQTQYCNVLLPGSTSCTGGAGFVTNPKHQLKGVWTDATPVPDDIVALGLAQNLVDDPIAAEAQRAAGHFGYDPQATYIILTPPSSDCDGSAGLLRLPLADHVDRRSGESRPPAVRIHPLAERELAGSRDGRMRHAQRQRDEQRLR